MFVCDKQATDNFLKYVVEDDAVATYVATNELLDAKYGIFFFDVFEDVLRQVVEKHDVFIQVTRLDLQEVQRVFEKMREDYKGR